MRRKDREITDFDEIMKIIDKCDTCRLALFDDEFPYIVPLNLDLFLSIPLYHSFFCPSILGRWHNRVT